MAIEFVLRDGVERSCRHCSEPRFILRQGLLELFEDARTTYVYRCNHCGFQNKIPMERFRGRREEQLFRIIIRGEEECL